jgi:hypothetical protein
MAALIVALVALVVLLVAYLLRPPAPEDLRAVVRTDNQRRLRDPRRLLR